ncbi:MAG: uracil-DNA glycosylase, partial [Sphingorhabdus sp.]
MITARLASEDDFDGWREQCRGLLRLGARPADIVWQVGEQRTDLFANPESNIEAAPIGVPKGFAELSRSVICHSDPERFGLLYQLLI